MNANSYWIGVAAKGDVDAAVAGGFTQVNHGKAAPLERMRAGDGFVFYSPRTAYPGGEPIQAFTAIARVRTGAVYQQALTAEFRPFRVDVDYLPSQPAPIKPLIAQRFPLAEARRAQELLGKGGVIGKIVLVRQRGVD